jgi:hypothetical protein
MMLFRKSCLLGGAAIMIAERRRRQRQRPGQGNLEIGFPCSMATLFARRAPSFARESATALVPPGRWRTSLPARRINEQRANRGQCQSEGVSSRRRCSPIRFSEGLHDVGRQGK